MKTPETTSSLQRSLRKRLEGSTRVVVLAVGSEERGDDAAGIACARRLEQLKAPACVLYGGSAPENLTGEIRRIAPSHVIIIDAADLGAKPGSVRLIDAWRAGGFSGSTHRVPLSVLCAFIAESIGCHVVIAGIQPATLAHRAGLSRGVRAGSERLARAIADALPAPKRVKAPPERS